MSVRGLIPLGFAGVGGVALATYWSSWRRRQVSVVSWNLLATPWTKYEAPYHRNPAGKIEAPGGIETDEQSRLRYSRAGAMLLSENPHVALLQECEPAFFSPSRNKHADALLKRYQLLPCFSWKVDGDIEPGTAVLLRRDAVKALDVVPRCVGGHESVGGTDKFCTVVDASVHGKEFTFASGHFTWDGAAAKREHHMNLLEPVLSRRPRFVLGGDFNAVPEPSLAQLRKQTWLQDADMIPLDPCTGTFKNMRKQGENETLDHFFVSRGLHVVEGSALQEPRCPYGVGTPAEVVAASDHVPIRIVVDCTS